MGWLGHVLPTLKSRSCLICDEGNIPSLTRSNGNRQGGNGITFETQPKNWLRMKREPKLTMMLYSSGRLYLPDSASYY